MQQYLSKFVHAVLIIGFFFLAFKLICSQLETKLFPVVSDFVVKETTEVSLGWTEIHGEFQKHRQCRLETLSMFYIQGELAVPIQYVWQEGPVLRIEGKQAFGPWHIQVSPDQIARVVAVSRHRCHPFWHTTTKSNLVRG